MSEKNNMRNIRWKLMTTASVLTLCASVYGAGQAEAAGADRPTVWVDLGGQIEQLKGFGDPYAVPFASELVADGFESPIKAQHVLGKSFEEEGAISFRPEGSDWIFSASIRYGRAGGGTTRHQQTKGCPCLLSFTTSSGYLHTGYISPPGAKFSETRVNNSERHTILDFQAGKDVGLGLFGSESRSTLGFGVRFAQFASKQHLGVLADPDRYIPLDPKYAQRHHTYNVTSHIERDFHGVGPTISWNASAPLAGNPDGGEISVDWGVNAAVLFGRQKVRGHHQTIGTYYKRGLKYQSSIPIHRSGNPSRARAVSVPNLGGFAGISYQFIDAKLSIGYRADFFFGALDAGVDVAKKTTLGFNGPYANISIGLGD